MPISSKEAEKNALKDAAEFMAVAARTAPKTRGRDNIETLVLLDGDVKKLIPKMKEIGERDGRPSCIRDAGSLENVEVVFIIGTKTGPLGLNCGFCNFPACAELEKSGGVCAYNSMDLGIALGSASSVAARFHADNRMMYAVGKAALELGLFDEAVRLAIGIPLSATGKNTFFDRK